MSTRIRPAKGEDATEMLDIYAPIVRDTAISFETRPPEISEFRSRIRASLEQRLWLACESEGSIAGYAYATQFNAREAYIWSVEVSVYVRPSHHRRGIGRALYTSLFLCLALQGYCTAVGRITLPNPASVALHESMGFQPVGTNPGIGYKNGQWHDVGIWQREIQPLPTLPEVPRPMEAVAHTREWAAALSSGEALIDL